MRLPPRFTREDVWAAVPGLHEKTVNVYLSNLTGEGVIARVAPNTFERLEPTTIHELRPGLQPVVAVLQGKMLPSLLQRVIVWGEEDLAPFTHDAIVVPFTVVEAPPQATDTLRSLLDSQFKVEPVRGRARLAPTVWELGGKASPNQPSVFLVGNTDLLGTWPAEGGVRIPKPERLFVDLLGFTALVPEAPLRILQLPSFDVQLALRIAGQRSETAPIASFLTWAAMLHADRPFAKAVRNKFAHMQWSDLGGER